MKPTLKNLSDVQELIKALDLPRAFGDQVDAYVRDTCDSLWTAAEESAGTEQ
ncbi:MAG TPA: hypothetical protein VKT77_00585 [Chthonomonadaceae bacterium]|nr:hypothetical protein [Chthonomonadaceae bacterium]